MKTTVSIMVLGGFEMKLTLAELLPLKVTMSKLLHEKIAERETIAYIEFAKGEEETVPDRTFDELTTEIREIRKDYRKIDYIIAKANVENLVEWEDGRLSIVEAIELAKQIRGEANLLKEFSRSKPMERLTRYHMEEATYRKALFDPSKLRKRAEKLEKKANRLSMMIEKQNHKVESEFEEASKYL